MTLKEITTTILNSLRGGRFTDDEPIHPKQIEFLVNNHRALLISAYLKGMPDLSMVDNEVITQDLGCVPTIQVDKTECDIKSECYITRTTNKIPTPLVVKNMPALTYVGSITRDHNIQLIPNA